MTGFDFTRMRELGERYKQQRDETERTRAELMAEVEAAEASGARQVDIVNASQLTRERLRQIRVAKEKSAARKPLAKRGPRRKPPQ